MLSIPPHLEACRPRGLFSIFHGTSSPVARRCPRASDLVLSAEHAFLLYERPGLHLQSGASAVGGVLHGARRSSRCFSFGAICDFNPRAPCGARRQPQRHPVNHLHISIHAPRAGCDVKSLASCAYSFYFNPRTPCGVRRRVYSSISQRKIFQSTHPVRGATSGVATSGLRRTQFQSTHPVRGATPLRLGLSPRLRRFQSTHPVRGATPQHAQPHREHGNFNPRTPCGVRPGTRDHCQRSHQFQSTHPVRGATTK